jgi:hypothetical protein
VDATEFCALLEECMKLLNASCKNSVVEFAKRKANVYAYTLVGVTTSTTNPQLY